jgi:predicted lipoprotein
MVFLTIRFGFTVVTIEEANQTVQNETFNPVTFVDSIWDSKILPTFDKEAVDLSKILGELETDSQGLVLKDSLIGVTNHYGLITVGEAHVYMVRGNGKIIAVNTETSLGTIEVAIDDYTGPVKVLLYVGPRIPSDESSVRDAVGFISFGDFKEQTEYGKVGSEINKRILSEVLGSLDKEQLIGKSISFEGAYNIRTFNLVQIDLKEIKIVPVQMSVGE